MGFIDRLMRMIKDRHAENRKSTMERERKRERIALFLVEMDPTWEMVVEGTRVRGKGMQLCLRKN